MLEAMSGVMVRTHTLLVGIHLIAMVLLPSEFPQAAVAQLTGEEAPVQSSVLTHALPKVEALGLGDRLSALAATTVIGQQRGLMLDARAPARRQGILG